MRRLHDKSIMETNLKFDTILILWVEIQKKKKFEGQLIEKESKKLNVEKE